MTKEEQMYSEERQLKAIVKCNLMTTDCVTTGTLARRLKMKASELYRKLKERKILYHSDGMWMLMPEYTGLGLLRYRYTLYYTLLGEKKLRVEPPPAPPKEGGFEERGGNYFSQIARISQIGAACF